MKDAAQSDWETKPLGEVATIVNGGTPKSKVAEYWGGNVQWLTPKDMGQMDGRKIAETPRKITEAGLAGSSARLAPAGSVILSTRAPIGHLAMNTVPMAFNQGCRGVVPSEKLDPVYLFHFLDMSRDILSDLGTGTTFKELSSTNLKSVEIPLPPLEEQQRIVAVLDEAFEGLARARAHAEANLQNAHELRQSSLQNVFGSILNSGEVVIANGWQKKKLGDLSTVSSGGTPLKSTTEFWGGEIPWYSSGELNGNFTIDPKNKITACGLRGSNAKLFPKGSLLIGMYDTAAMKMAVLDREAAFNQAVAGIKPAPEVDLRYVQVALEAVKPKIMDQRRGTRQKNLSLKKIKGIEILLPPLGKQQRIIAVLDEAFEGLAKAVELYQVKLQDLDDLRQSLLQKAFAGKLT